MKKLFAVLVVAMVAWCSLLFAQAGDHFAEGRIASIENGIITIIVPEAEAQSIDFKVQDFTSLERNDQQIPLSDLSINMKVSVAYYDYPDEDKVLTHLVVLE